MNEIVKREYRLGYCSIMMIPDISLNEDHTWLCFYVSYIDHLFLPVYKGWDRDRIENHPDSQGLSTHHISIVAAIYLCT